MSEAAASYQPGEMCWHQHPLRPPGVPMYCHPLTEPCELRVLCEARSWISTPFSHQAQVKGQGVDCVQLLIACYKAGACLPPEFAHTGYSRGWHLRDNRYVDLLGPHVTLREGPPQPADIAMFRNRLPSGRVTPFPCHAGIVTKWPALIHADPELGVVEVADCSRGMPGPFSCALQPRALAGAAC